jgi:acyl-CoA thioesterase I
MARSTLSVFVSSLLLAGLAAGQTADKDRLIADLEHDLTESIRLLTDWGGLTRFGSDNAELGPPKPGETRVVFFGDDVFAGWTSLKHLNRGIERQTTPQMLVRFRQDVIELKPKVVVIQGGSNDIAGMMGPATQGTAAENIRTMVELAQLHGIKVVLASVTPVCDCQGKTWSDRRTVGRLRGVNEWLESYAKSTGAVYADFYSPLLEGRWFKKAWTVDGLVPNEAGYAALAPVAEAAIAKALGR